MNILTICRRELATFFDSLMAYIIMVVFLGLSGFFTWMFGSDIFFVGQASLGVFFNIAFWTLFFFIPAITMRTIAEERRSGTLELLLTKPLNDFEIITGKWLACLALIFFMLILTLPYYFTVAALGNIDHGVVFSGYFALLAISAVYISIGILASSVTDNQIVAFILSLSIAFVFHVLFDVFASILPGSASYISNFLSINNHFQVMTRGIIAVENITYLSSVTISALLLAAISLKRRLWA